MSFNVAVLTGASKGFGKCILSQLHNLGITHVFALCRSKVEQTEHLKLFVITVDFSNEESLISGTNTLINELQKLKLASFYLINNAGSLGRLSRVEHLELHDFKAAFSVNLTSPAYLTSKLISKFSQQTDKFVIVNISSLAAIKPFDCWSLYCSGKAAREMFHLNIVEEHGDGIRVLNYAPGPLDTDMQAEIREKMPKVPLRDTFQEMKQHGTLVDPMESAKKLISILRKDEYSNGKHIDYFDNE